MNLSDLAVRLRQLAAQWQVDGSYDPAQAAILTESDDGIVRFYPAMVAKLGPVIREARARGAFDPAHVAGIGLLIDGSASDGQLFGSLHQHLRSRGIHCWGIDARAGAIERLADVFDALALPERPALRDEGQATAAPPATVLTSNLEAMSAESKRYLQELSASFSTNKALMMLFVRWVTENPSLQGITPTDEWVNILREWMAHPAGAGTIDGMRGEMERTKLRAKIRQSFPLLPLHYWMLATKADDAVRNIQDVRIPDPGKLADATATAFAEARWLDDPAMPDPPDDALLNRAQAMAAMTRLGNWLKSRAAEIERGSVPQQPAEQVILPAKQAKSERETGIAFAEIERPETYLDRPIIRPPGRIRVQVQGGGLFTDEDRCNYQNWWEPATAEHDEILFLMNDRPFLYQRAKRPRLELESAPGDTPVYFDMDSTVRLLSVAEAVRWFERHGRDVPDVVPFTAAVKLAAVDADTPDPTVKPDPVAVPDGVYSPTDIAKAIGNPSKAEAIRKALGRMMDDNRLPDGAWMENNNPAKGQARILYKLSMVRPFLSRFESATGA